MATSPTAGTSTSIGITALSITFTTTSIHLSTTTNPANTAKTTPYGSSILPVYHIQPRSSMEDIATRLLHYPFVPFMHPFSTPLKTSENLAVARVHWEEKN